MGRLNLPAHGSYVYLDACILIYTLDRIPPYADLLTPFWSQVALGGLTCFTSELSLLETLVKPLQTTDRELHHSYFDFLTNNDNLQLLPITKEILIEAARLRASTSLKAPDAIHMATAMFYAADLILSNDTGWQQVVNAPLLLLDQALATP